MNRWRLAIILLCLVAVVILIGSTQIGWEPQGFLNALRTEMRSEPTYQERLFPRPTHGLLTVLSVLVTFFLTGIMMIYTFPRRISWMKKFSSASLTGLLRLTGLGFIMWVLVIILSLTSALTIVTFPLGIFLGISLFLSSYAGFVSLSYALGQQLLARADWGYLSPVYALLLGLVLLYPLAEIPFIGLLFKILFASLGTGIVIASRFGSGEPWSLSPYFE